MGEYGFNDEYYRIFNRKNEELREELYKYIKERFVARERVEEVVMQLKEMKLGDKATFSTARSYAVLLLEDILQEE